MNKNILVTGAEGQLGSRIKLLSSSYAQYNFFFTDKKKLNITQPDQINNFLQNNPIDIIINCAAYTRVDDAEHEKDLVYLTNHLAVESLANIVKERGIELIHISSDYVFDGKNNRPYRENDPCNAHGVYAQSKRQGEESILAINPANSMIIRTAWLYSEFGKSFLQKVLERGKKRNEIDAVVDQAGTPTYAADLAHTILEIVPQLNNSTTDICHYSNEGVASWYDFAQVIFEYANIDCHINAALTSQYPTPAPRPHYTVLDKTKIKTKYGINIPYWRKSVKECLQTLGEKQ